jgi:hypothetical protein
MSRTRLCCIGPSPEVAQRPSPAQAGGKGSHHARLRKRFAGFHAATHHSSYAAHSSPSPFTLQGFRLSQSPLAADAVPAPASGGPDPPPARLPATVLLPGPALMRASGAAVLGLGNHA